MQITSRQRDGLLEFQVAGRLDAYWADHFTSSVLAAVRQGHHRIRVDLSAVDYISSAGLGALMKCFNELRELAGTFRISGASKFVEKTLTMTGLHHLLAPPEVLGAPAAVVACNNPNVWTYAPDPDSRRGRLSPAAAHADADLRRWLPRQLGLRVAVAP